MENWMISWRSTIFRSEGGCKASSRSSCEEEKIRERFKVEEGGTAGLDGEPD